MVILDSGIIIEAFKLLWKNKRFYLVVALIKLVLLLINFAFFYDVMGNRSSFLLNKTNYITSSISTNNVGNLVSTIFFLNIIMILVDSFLGWIVARFVYIKLIEQKFDLISNIIYTGQRLLKLITVNVLYIIIVYFGIVVFFLVSILFSMPGILLLGYVLFLLPIIILSIMFIFRSYGVLLDNDSILNSLKRSMSLTKYHKLEIFFTMLLLNIMFLPINFVLMLAPGTMNLLLLIPLNIVYSMVYINVMVIWYFRLRQNFTFAAEISDVADEDGYFEGEHKPFCPNCMKIYDDYIIKCPECGFYLERQ